MTEVVVTLERVPQVAPEQPEPESVQVTPLFCVSFCRVTEKAVDWETCTEVEAGFTETEIGAGAVVIVIAAEADFVASAIEIAANVTAEGLGAVAGAL